MDCFRNFIFCILLVSLPSFLQAQANSPVKYLNELMLQKTANQFIMILLDVKSMRMRFSEAYGYPEYKDYMRQKSQEHGENNINGGGLSHADLYNMMFLISPLTEMEVAKALSSADVRTRLLSLVLVFEFMDMKLELDAESQDILMEVIAELETDNGRNFRLVREPIIHFLTAIESSEKSLKKLTKEIIELQSIGFYLDYSLSDIFNHNERQWSNSSEIFGIDIVVSQDEENIVFDGTVSSYFSRINHLNYEVSSADEEFENYGYRKYLLNQLGIPAELIARFDDYLVLGIARMAQQNNIASDVVMTKDKIGELDASLAIDLMTEPAIMPYVERKDYLYVVNPYHVLFRAEENIQLLTNFEFLLLYLNPEMSVSKVVELLNRAEEPASVSQIVRLLHMGFSPEDISNLTYNARDALIITDRSKENLLSELRLALPRGQDITLDKINTLVAEKGRLTLLLLLNFYSIEEINPHHIDYFANK